MYGHNDSMTDMEREVRIGEVLTGYPQSSCNEKPCCMCDSHDPVLNCYSKNENIADCRKCYWRNICIRHNPVECSYFKKEYGD